MRNGATPDFYKITADGNKTIEIETSTPAGGSGQFVNALDPTAATLQRGGQSVGLQRQRGHRNSDGRNAKLSYKVPEGTQAVIYYVEVTSAATAAPANQGEYLLSVKASTAVQPPFQVTATTPADGTTSYDTVPSQITVDFNDNILLPRFRPRT